MASYELWNTTSGNLVGTFTSETEALEAVRQAVETHGLGYGDAFALGRETSRGTSRVIASGRDPVDRAAAPRPTGSHRKPAQRDRIA